MDHSPKGCHDLAPKSTTSQNTFFSIIKEGLWKNNPTLVQVLGMCPTMAITTSAANALGMGIATMIIMAMSNFFISLFRRWIPTEIRIPVYVLLIAALVTCLQLLMNAYTFALYQSLGIFIALIVTNCLVVGRAEAFANQNPPLSSAFDGFMMGMGFTLSLTILGCIREILGQGTLFAGADVLFGQWAAGLKIDVYHSDNTFLLAILPPGAFLVLGFMIALKNIINAHFARKKSPVKTQIERVRVTTF
ncbi:electron transport complex subunit E [Tolumonas lignilytica]|jgi:electron transport complex, RnfABCDGE type, E subunit|uniref:electron transport complex subunit E n=1 Tax=Tolumonas lignilytica TaxID=1283284 RepID=UPI000464855A|nr:electron transport complex subunit E [Tolumonas lignilytica]